MLAAALLWLLIALEAALFAVLTYRRRVPLFRLWLVFAVLGALTAVRHPHFEHAYWVDWVFGERMVMVARFLMVAEAFWIATVGLAASPRAKLAIAGVASASAAVIAAWSVRQQDLAGFVQLRLYSHIFLFVFCLAMIFIHWSAGKRPATFAIQHGLLITWILAGHAIVACMDRFIVTGAAWTSAWRIRVVTLCLGLACGIWFNRPLSGRVPAGPAPNAQDATEGL